MMACHYLTFAYDQRGYGILELHNDSLIPWSGAARTGYVDRHGVLQCAIMPGRWTIRTPSVSTTEPAMWVYDSREGWKVRLWTPAGEWSRYLIHPDGGRPGTEGCIGILQQDARELRERIDQILERQATIAVYVNVAPGKEIANAA